MILTCKECDTSFNFDERLLKPGGSKVRCSKCQSVFLVQPQGSAKKREALTAATSAGAAGGSAAGLDDLDLNEIENMLDLDSEESAAGDSQPGGAGSDFQLDLNFDEEGADDDASADAEYQETQALDLTADDSTASSDAEDDELGFELDLGEETPAAGDDRTESVAADDLDFELDLDLDGSTDASAGAAAASASASDELRFDLDLESEGTPAKGEGSNESSTASSDGLDFELDLDLDAEEEAEEPEPPVADVAEASDDLDFNLDLDLDEPSAGAASDEVAFDVTQEAGLSDVDDLLDLDEAEAAAKDAPDALDLALEDGGVSESLTNAKEPVDELDFDLDLEPESGDAPAGGAAAGDEAEELDIDDLVEIGDEAAGSAEEDFAIDFDTPQSPAKTAAGSTAPGFSMEETEELDLTGLEDALELEGGGTAQDAGGISLEKDSGSGDNGFDLSELHMAAEDAAKPSDSPAGEATAAELDFDFDLGEPQTGGAQEATAADESEDEDVEFDLSDLDDMLETNGDAPAAAETGTDEYDLELDLDASAGGGSDDMDIDFDEADVTGDPTALPSAAGTRDPEGVEDSFAMSDFPDMDVGSHTGDEDDYMHLDEEGESAPARKKSARSRIGAPVKVLLYLVLLVGGGIGAVSALQYFGISVPYLDKVQIPYVSEFLGIGTKDTGNLKMTIDGKDLNGFFVENSRLGTLFVISGNVKNDYDHPRSFIALTGKLFVKGQKLFGKKMVFAGNVLSDQQLSTFDQAAIDKFFKNRGGEKRSNLNVPRGQSVPFMMVFSGLPKNLDEYTVEVTSSMQGSGKVGKKRKS